MLTIASWMNRNNAGGHAKIISQDILYACGYSYSITSADSSVMINGNFATIQEEDLAGMAINDVMLSYNLYKWNELILTRAAS